MHGLLVTVVALCFAFTSGSVLDTAKSNGCSKLYDLVVAAGLKQAVDSAKDITLFAPSDAAINAIPPDVLNLLNSNTTLLQDVLKFHVVTSVKMAASLKNDEQLPTLFGTYMLRTNIYKNGQVVTAEGSVVSKADLTASNGVVHVIDKVIYPVPTLNIPLFLTFDKELNNLGFMAYQAKLIDTLSAQSFTVFAPSNAAIEKLSGQQYNDLLMNITELTGVLTFHVVKGTVFSSGLSDGQKVTTVEGSELEVKIGTGGVTVNGAKVTQADISTTNGVIHVIDTILFPPKAQSSNPDVPVVG